MSFDNIRVGEVYFLQNFGEKSVFEVLEVMPDGDYRVKDIDSLEIFFVKDLIKYGKGNDYAFGEVKV
jgi:hypothetical protein